MEEIKKSRTYYYLGTFLVAFALIALMAVATMETIYGHAPQLYITGFSVFALLIFVLSFVMVSRDLKRGKALKVESNILSILRFVLSTVMLGYAFTKLRNGHMYLSYFSLDNRLNDLSEFDTVWSFYGRFSAFQAFIGLLELLPSVLLLFRRTAFLGTVIMLPVLSNVVALNIFYHIGGFTLPLSGLLLCFNLYLLYSYKDLLMDFFKRVKHHELKDLEPRSTFRKGLGFLKFLPLVFLGLLILIKIIAPSHKQPIHGAYELTSFKLNDRVINKDSLPADAYTKIYFEKRHVQNSLINPKGPQGAMITFPSEGKINIAYRNGPLDMYVQEDTVTMFKGSYVLAGDENLTLNGKQNGQMVEAKYRKIPLKEYAYWWE